MSQKQSQKLLARLRSGLAKSRTNLSYQVKNVFQRDKITDEVWDDLESALIGADVGMGATLDVIDNLRKLIKEEQIHDPAALKDLLKKELVKEAQIHANNINIGELGDMSIILMVGVNGTGKTTSIGKLAAKFISDGKDVILIAADTFRAAAIEQLQKWADRSGANLIKHQRGADAAAVVYDGVQSLKAKGRGIGIIDTAGRLHTYVNLMEELKKVKRVALREAGTIPVLTLLVIDATTGQNGIAQATSFHEALGLDGLVLTKLDGTAKGGIAIAIQKQLGVPILMIGVGEGIDDLRAFAAKDFVDALLD